MTHRNTAIWGWYAFDWASQPFHTLILTFVFAPYLVTVIGDPVQSQTLWAQTLTLAGLATALLAPVVGAMADRSGRLRLWVTGLSAVYVLASGALWFAAPGGVPVALVLGAFALGLIAVELATIVTNAFLPALAPRSETGRLSGTGFALGYLGGLVALVIMLGFFAQNDRGLTFFGRAPAFGLDPATHEGTRFVGPFTALWYLAFMLPFFLWLKDPPRRTPPEGVARALRGLGAEIRAMLRAVAGRRSLMAFLAGSMLYRDALAGLYAFGGIYARGVLGWSITQVGVFGLIGATVAGLACWIGGRLDTRHGPKPVIRGCILLLAAVCVVVAGLGRQTLFGMPLPPGSALPDVIFYVCGALIGGAGGMLQSSSRSLMVRHTDPARPTAAFGLYALSGKATAFVAPLLVAIATEASQSQRLGVSPLIALFMAGLLLLSLVGKDGDI